MKERDLNAIMQIVTDCKTCEPDALVLVKERFHRALAYFGLTCKRLGSMAVERDSVLYVALTVDGEEGIIAVDGGFSEYGTVRFLSGQEADDWLSEHGRKTA